MPDNDLGNQTAALGDARDRLNELNGLAGKFGSTLTKAFSGGIAQGKSFDDILKGVGQKFIQIGLQTAFKPLEAGVKSLLGSLLQGVSGFGSQLGGGSGSGTPVTPFADGGVISSPGYFPLGRGLGLAGEAGAEAIMPLSRGSDGRLGVAASGGGSTQITVNITTPDVAGFARSEAQVSAALARAVSRGRRGS